MAVPFNIPGEEDTNGSSSAVSTTPSTPSHPIPQQSPNNTENQQISSIDNEMLVQAFYEALCRCSQVGSPGQFTQSQPHFWFPSPSTSNASSPRSSFRNVPRQRSHSLGSLSQYSSQSDGEFYELDQSNRQSQREQINDSSQIPGNKKKKQSRNKFTGFVISALEFVIDHLK